MRERRNAFGVAYAWAIVLPDGSYLPDEYGTREAAEAALRQLTVPG